jgi:phosphopantothenoylcysteine decarboxylase/phosphopantothenate--cysteine ligase
MGAEVTLVAGPVSLPTPPGVTRVDVRRAAQMREAVLAALPGMDAYIGAAAVADYAPAETLPQKLKKSGESLAITLVRTADILADVAAHAARPRLVVGFAAETQDLEAYARDKLHRKGLDLIAANDVSRAGHGFEGDDNALSVFWREGRHDIAHGPKTRVARDLLQLLADRLEAME